MYVRTCTCVYTDIFSLLMKTKSHKNSCHDIGLLNRKLDPEPSQKIIKITYVVMYRDHAIFINTDKTSFSVCQKF